jgi:hypothetical protein
MARRASRTYADSCRIDHACVAQGVAPNPGLERTFRSKIHPPAKQFREFFLQAEELPTDGGPGLEFDQHVNVRIGPLFAARRRSKYRHLPNLVTSADARDPLSGDFQSGNQLHRSWLHYEIVCRCVWHAACDNFDSSKACIVAGVDSPSGHLALIPPALAA